MEDLCNLFVVQVFPRASPNEISIVGHQFTWTFRQQRLRTSTELLLVTVRID